MACFYLLRAAAPYGLEGGGEGLLKGESVGRARRRASKPSREASRARVTSRYTHVTGLGSFNLDSQTLGGGRHQGVGRQSFKGRSRDRRAPACRSALSTAAIGAPQRAACHSIGLEYSAKILQPGSSKAQDAEPFMDMLCLLVAQRTARYLRAGGLAVAGLDSWGTGAVGMAGADSAFLTDSRVRHHVSGCDVGTLNDPSSALGMSAQKCSEHWHALK